MTAGRRFRGDGIRTAALRVPCRALYAEHPMERISRFLCFPADQSTTQSVQPPGVILSGFRVRASQARTPREGSWGRGFLLPCQRVPPFPGNCTPNARILRDAAGPMGPAFLIAQNDIGGWPRVKRLRVSCFAGYPSARSPHRWRPRPGCHPERIPGPGIAGPDPSRRILGPGVSAAGQTRNRQIKGTVLTAGFLQTPDSSP